MVSLRVGISKLVNVSFCGCGSGERQEVTRSSFLSGGKIIERRDAEYVQRFDLRKITNAKDLPEDVEDRIHLIFVRSCDDRLEFA